MKEKGFKNSKADKPLTGWIPGLLAPPLTFVIIWILLASNQPLGSFITKTIAANVLSKFLSIATLPNLLIFFIFIWLKMDRAAKGTLYATFVVALLVIALKFTL